MNKTVARARELLLANLGELSDVIQRFWDNPELRNEYASIAAAIVEAFRGGKTLLIAGNGGSHAEATHLAGELIAGFENKKRPGLRALAIPSSLTVATAWVNDADPKDLMVREVETWGEEGGVLLLLSTSGESENQIRAARRAHELGMKVCAWLGKTGGELGGLANHSVIVPTMKTSRAQEVHLSFLHVLCCLIDEEFAPT